MTPEERLRQVRHIVVLMMENRSFDHMLGYLGLDPAFAGELDGLQGEHYNLDPNGNRIDVHRFDANADKVQRRREALIKGLDPGHSPKGVARQIGTDPERNDGFVLDYAATRPEGFDPALWGVPMGYYDADSLPTYDHLARHYCVCDAWHASIPGDTWPNRLYALAGREARSLPPRNAVVRLLSKVPLLKRLRLLKTIRGFPLYDVRAFTHQLDPSDWRWYAHDPATLRLADGSYRSRGTLGSDSFAWFDRGAMTAETILLQETTGAVERQSFIDHAVRGELPKVSWIDPNFFDAPVLDPNANDDHPPSDIRAGQQLAFDVYDALTRSPGWRDTVLVITYDEHGGFYDHVKPPPVTDHPRYRTLGLRVPALIVGPRVTRQVARRGEAVAHD